MRVPALFLGLAVALSMLAGCERGLARSQVLHYERSQYQEIYVVEGERRRCLQFARSDSIQSRFDLDDPLALQMPYPRAMMVGLLARPMPARVLMIGLGGASIPRALQALDPSMRIDVAELDPAVVRVAESHFGLALDARTQVFVDDGRAFVERQQRAGVQYDLVFLDAFDQDYIPEHLLTVEFLRSVQAVLAPGGAVVANTFRGKALPVHEAATYRAVFADLYQVAAGGNRILLAGVALSPMQQMRANAQRLEPALKRFGVSTPSLAERLEPVPRTDARPFTDRGWPAAVPRRRIPSRSKIRRRSATAREAGRLTLRGKDILFGDLQPGTGEPDAMREVSRSRTAESTKTSEAIPPTVDVRTIAAGERHRLAFSSFNALPQGAVLELVDDQDTAPLYRQFKSNFHGLFTWDDLEQGPDLWRVRIGKAPGNCCGSCS